MHIHIVSPDGEAKFWIEPKIELANNYCFSNHQLNELQKLVEEHINEIKNAWAEHFSS